MAGSNRFDIVKIQDQNLAVTDAIVIMACIRFGRVRFFMRFVQMLNHVQGMQVLMQGGKAEEDQQH